MKILIVNTYDNDGGAAKAAYRLHKGLQSIGIDSQMLVGFKTGDDPTVLVPTGRRARLQALVWRQLEKLPLARIAARIPTLFSPAWVSSPGIVTRINDLKPDLVHLHWVCNGYLRPEDLLEIKAPIVWSLHDNWAFTGGCHIKWQCQKFRSNCGNCPVLSSGRENDLSRRVWKRKQKVFSRLPHLTIIGLSKWLAAETRHSALFHNHSVINLPNLIDCSRYKPIDKAMARNLFNLPPAKKLIMFGAMEANSDINKGYNQLRAAMQYLANKNDIELVIFGSSPPRTPAFPGFVTHYPGRLHDDAALCMLYNAADVMIIPSLQENLSNTIMESLACGTPVVAFAVGGNADLIEHKQNGYLAEPLRPESLAEGIDWVLNHSASGQLSAKARQKIEDNFEMTKIARQYQQLYNTILS